jgi:dimethylhistidine N-methyltransferase
VQPINEDFRDDLIEALSRTPKTISPKWFYDERGSGLFEQITALPEYYPTRTETALLRRIAGELAEGVPDGAALVEFGSGASAKTQILLDATPQFSTYVPVDISVEALDAAAERIKTAYPGLEVRPVAGDFTRPIELPAEISGRRAVGFFPGSTIGNFGPQSAAAFLRSVSQLLGQGASLIVGLDIVKEPEVLERAYDDAAGVTAAFNMNLLRRANNEAGADFDLRAFEHRAVWNAQESRIEMHLVSRTRQDVHVAGRTFRFEAGEALHTENSYKFTCKGFEAMAAATGWRLGRSWISPPPEFAVFVLNQAS